MLRNTRASGLRDASPPYSIAYTSETTTAAYVGYQFIDGTLDGRKGSFVIEQRGSFVDDGIACAFTVPPGSGTGSSTARHGEKSTPYAFDHTLGVLG